MNRALAFDCGQFLIHLGRASHALVALSVPTNGAAHPLPAPVALVEFGRHFFDSLTKSRVVGLTPHHALDIESRGGRAPKNASENAIGYFQRPARYTQQVVLESRQVAVAATLAAELELETLVRREVLDIVGERNVSRHGNGGAV